MIPLVIRASAGTGKTYRLSLEFINLLLKYRLNFDEILVITFTKKATAEIRERIFEQLKVILSGSEAGQDLMRNIKLINPNLKFDTEEMAFLQEVYQRMITNKSAVRISTIDSFVNTVFSSIIAPFHNITEFNIDNTINAEILPEIYERILQDEKLENFQDIFFKAKRRNLDMFHSFIGDIIEKRWLFEFINPAGFQEIDLEAEKTAAFRNYQSAIKSFLNLLQEGIEKVKNPDETVFNTDFREAISPHLELKDFQFELVAKNLFSILTKRDFINENYSTFLNDKNIWNGKKIKIPELKEFYAEVQNCLADHIYYDKAFDEQMKIISLAAEVLSVYDEIKFRDRIFTHSDISYYTFRYLYDPQLSIVDQGNVLNLFYEQLSYNTRFVLIDEFQDTSILQWSIFHPMLKEISSGIGQKEYGGIIVVGDEKQAIYGWRGGERKLLTEFESILNEPVNYDSLEKSYRSKPLLMNWLNRLFGSDQLDFVPEWNYTEIACDKADGGFVQVDFVNTDREDKLEKAEIYREFVQDVLQPNLEKINPASTAILMRKNKELAEMALVLDEAGIDYTLETSGSLFSHPAVKPISFVLNFLVYEDIIELIKFLRSDLILMHPTELKEVIKIYHASEDLAEFLLNCNVHACFSVLHQLRDHSYSLLNLIKTILEHFCFSAVFASEIELKNLQRFLEVAAEFESANHEYTTDLPGFLQYCRYLSEKEEYSRIGQTISDSLKLLTIHKAKGLQFETVFAVFDVSGRSSGDNSGLNLYYQFAENFRSLQDFAFTFNYDKVLQKSRKRDLIDYVNRRDAGDELNNIYVALTRAQNNLFLYLHYAKKGDLEKFINDVKEEGSVLKNFTRTIYQEFNLELQQQSETHHQMRIGEISTDLSNQDALPESPAKLPLLFQIFSREAGLDAKEPDLPKLQAEFMQNKSVLIGNVVHEYLSGIKYNEPAEKQLSERRIIAKYGSLLPITELHTILSNLDVFLDSKQEIFDKSRWDEVFNEQIIFDEQGRESRIDRMMIDIENKLIKIIDYKTGSIHEKEQLDRYKAIIEKLPLVEKEDYRVDTEYVIIPS